MENDTERKVVTSPEEAQAAYLERLHGADDNALVAFASLIAPLVAADGKWGLANLIETLAQRLRVSKDAHKKLHDRIDALVSEVAEKNNEISLLKADYGDLRLVNDEFTGDLANANARLRKLTAENDELTKDLADAYTFNNDRLRKLTAENAELTKDLSAANDRLRKQVEASEKELKAAKKGKGG